MIDINKQYRTRDGREVRIYATDGMHPHCVHGVIKTNEGWSLTSWKRDGSFSCFPLDSDLIEVKPSIKRMVWLNVYPWDPVMTGAAYYYNKKEADKCSGENRIACVKIEIDCEEGEGL